MNTKSTEKLCPECNSRMTKAGNVRINRAGDTRQQWLCTKCNRRTINPKEDK